MNFESLVWIVPLLVAGLGAWKPRFGLVTFAAALPLFGSPPGGPYLAALDVAAVAAILTSVRAVKKRYPGEPDWRHSGLEWPVAAWVAVSLASMVPLVYHPPAWTANAMAGLLSALPGVQSGLPFHSWRALANLLLGVGLFFSVRRAFSGRSLLPLGYGLAAGSGLVVLLGLGEFSGLFVLDTYRVIGDPLYDSRLHSLFFHSAWLAEYLILAVPLAAAALLMGGRWSRVAGLTLIGLSALAVVFTQQRGAWLALLAEVAVLPMMLSRDGARRARWRWVALAVVVLLLVSAGAIAYLRPDLAAPVADRFDDLASDLSGRPALWGAAAELTKERPLLGWGLGSFATAYDKIHPPGKQESWRYRGTAHSLYFHTLAERGLLGLLALVALGWALLRGLREVTSRRNAGNQSLGTGLLVSFVGLIVYGLVQYVVYLKNIELLTWLLLGAASLVMAGMPQGGARRLAQVLCLAVLVATPWRWLTTEPLTSRYDRSYGFHEFEHQRSRRGLRWTEGRAMLLIPWDGEVLHVELVDGHPRASARQVDVVIRADGRRVWSGRVSDRWQEIDLVLGVATAETVAIGLTIEPTFRPAFDYRAYDDLQPSRDIRRLGIAMANFRWDAQPPSAFSLNARPRSR